jgi:trans-L-3-hydroxyproline dehydratase
VEKSSFLNVPSFVYLKNETVEIPGLGKVPFDVAYGGAFYAIVDAQPLNLSLTARNINLLVDLGRRMKQAVAASFPIEHPFEKELGFLYGVIFTAPAQKTGYHSRNVCVFAEGEVDRSATGSGVSARAALHHSKGELAVDEPITIESITGSSMTVRVVERTKFGPYDAVIPEVSGSAHFTGRNEIWIDPADPFGRGFLIR